MVCATVERHAEVILRRTYYDPALSLDEALSRMEFYITAEGLNIQGECRIRVWFPAMHTEAA